MKVHPINTASRFTAVEPAIPPATIRQWEQLKKLYPQQLVLLGQGDSYISFGDDARKISHATGIPAEQDGFLPYIRLGHDAVHETILSKLVQARYAVAICDELSAPENHLFT